MKKENGRGEGRGRGGKGGGGGGGGEGDKDVTGEVVMSEKDGIWNKMMKDVPANDGSPASSVGSALPWQPQRGAWGSGGVVIPEGSKVGGKSLKEIMAEEERQAEREKVRKGGREGVSEQVGRGKEGEEEEREKVTRNGKGRTA